MFRYEPEYQYRDECCAPMAFTLPSEFWQTKPATNKSNARFEAARLFTRDERKEFSDIGWQARRTGVTPSLLFNWRRRMLEGGLPSGPG